jgi:hypothetical protein
MSEAKGARKEEGLTMFWLVNIWGGGLSAGESWTYLVRAKTESGAVKLARWKNAKEHPGTAPDYGYAGLPDGRTADGIRQLDLRSLKVEEVASGGWGW